MENIIPAYEAQRLTKEAIDKDNSVLDIPMEKIKRAISMKDYHCYISGNTSDIALNKLMALGYKVQLIKADPRDPRETDMYKISWK